MQFYNTGKHTKGNVGSILLTFCAVVLSFILTQLVCELIAVKYFGFSFVSIPPDVSSNVVFTLMLLPFVAVFFTLIYAVKTLHGQPLLSLFTTRDAFDWRRFMISFSLWGTFLFVILGINVLFGEELVWNFNLVNFFVLLLISLTLLPVQTTVEELVFRGYLFQQLSRIIPRAWISILITGTIFGLLHGANPEVAKLGSYFVLFYIVTGIFLGILTHMDNGLELSMGYHAVNNIFAAVFLTNDWQVFQTDALFKSVTEPPHAIEVILTICIIQPILLLIYARIFRWKNWKSRLFG